MIGGMRGSDADSEVKLPLRREVDVNAGEKLLLLISERVESGQWSISRVILQPASNFLCEIVAEFHVGREPHTLIHAGTVKGPVQRGIKREIPPPDFLVDNRTNLQGPRVRRKRSPLVAEFRR